MRIAIIVAAAENGVIGCNGDLPWRLPSDLRHFRALTMGKPVIMGRKTFQSLRKPLDGRDNIVVTRDSGFQAAGARVVASLFAALELARQCAQERGADEIMVIGGAQIYAAARNLADRIYLTRVHAEPAGDARFEPPEAGQWRLVNSQPMVIAPGDDHAATFDVLDRISTP